MGTRRRFNKEYKDESVDLISAMSRPHTMGSIFMPLT